jgi:predicted HD phosphohydrolase
MEVFFKSVLLLPYSFHSCTLIHDVGPFCCQQNEDTSAESETPTHQKGPKIWVLPQFPSGKTAHVIQFLVKSL